MACAGAPPTSSLLASKVRGMPTFVGMTGFVTPSDQPHSRPVFVALSDGWRHFRPHALAADHLPLALVYIPGDAAHLPNAAVHPLGASLTRLPQLPNSPARRSRISARRPGSPSPPQPRPCPRPPRSPHPSACV